MMYNEGFKDKAITTLLSLQIWTLTSWGLGWKETWSRKLSQKWFPGENFLYNREKVRKNLLHLLSMSMRELLRHKACFEVSLIKGIQCLVRGWELSWIVNDLIMWFGGSKNPLRRNLLYNFFKWRWIGISPAIASIPSIDKVQKAPIIQMATLYCIFLKTLSE